VRPCGTAGRGALMEPPDALFSGMRQLIRTRRYAAHVARAQAAASASAVNHVLIKQWRRRGGKAQRGAEPLVEGSAVRARCWHRFPDQSWSLVESIAAADTGPVLYLGTFVTAGECAVACRAYSHMDTRCTAFTFFHFDDTTRALQCLGAVEGSLESHKATTAPLSPSHAISAVFQVIVLVSF
jgi:hypothetical protein